MSRIGCGITSPLSASPMSTKAVASSSTAGLSPRITPEKPTAKCYHFIEVFACNCRFPDDKPKISHVRGCEGLKDMSKCKNLVTIAKQIYVDDLCVACKSEAAMNEDSSEEEGGTFGNFIRSFKNRPYTCGKGLYNSMDIQHEDENFVGGSQRKHSWSRFFSPHEPEGSEQMTAEGLAGDSMDYDNIRDPIYSYNPAPRFTADDDAESWKDGCPLLSPPDDRAGMAEALRRAYERSIKYPSKETANTKHHGKETADAKAEKAEKAWRKSRNIWLSMPSVDNGAAIPESPSSVVSSIFGGFCKALTPRYSLDDLSSEPGSVDNAEIEKWVNVSGIAKEELNGGGEDLSSWEVVD